MRLGTSRELRTFHAEIRPAVVNLRAGRARRGSQIAREIRKIAFAALLRLQAQLLILGRITALEKVGSFILEMAARLSDGDAHQVALPVSRYDIADYLGVSVETVSRSLSDLKHRGAIKLQGTRSVSIVDRDVLEEGERHEHRGHEHRNHEHRGHEHQCHA